MGSHLCNGEAFDECAPVGRIECSSPVKDVTASLSGGRAGGGTLHFQHRFQESERIFSGMVKVAKAGPAPGRNG